MNESQNTVTKVSEDQANKLRPLHRRARASAQLFLLIAITYVILFQLICASSTLAQVTILSFPLNLFVTAIIGEWLGQLILSCAYIYHMGRVTAGE